MSKEGKSAIAFCHFGPLFSNVACGLLGNCIVLGSLFFKTQKLRLAAEIYQLGGHEC